MTTPPEEAFSIIGSADAPIELPIAAGPATGHSWFLQLPALVTRLPDGPAPARDHAQRIGGAASGALRVSAPPGEYLIRAELARPWERDKPARRVVIQLRVA